MIKLSYGEIVSKIKEKAGATEKEIEIKVNEKLTKLSGLISREGAAHIVANELGVKLVEQVSGRLQIKNVLAGMRDVETVGKIVQIYEAREFQSGERRGKVGSMVVGDETGTIRLVFWGEQTSVLDRAKSGDIIKIVGGYVKDNQGRKEIHLNDRANCALNPNGEKIESVEFSQQPSQRKKIKDLSESDNAVDIMGTVVQVFEPRFYEICPQCGKRSRMSNGVFVCPSHNEVRPDYSYVLNAVIDDGTETIRTAFFRQSAEKLLKKDSKEILAIKDAPEKFNGMRNELNGTIIKVSGRVNKNAMFDRIEFVANNVDTEPNPEEELKRLKEENAH